MTIAFVFKPSFFAYLRAMRVSKLSPDCDMTNIELCPNIDGFRYLYSEARSTITGTSAICSIQYLPTKAA